MNQLATHVFTNGLRIDPPVEADPAPAANYMTSLRNDPEQQMRNVAAVLMRYTEVKRHHNGKGRCATYSADLDTIAQTGRQLAEMVEAYFNTITSTEEADNELDF